AVLAVCPLDWDAAGRCRDVILTKSTGPSIFADNEMVTKMLDKKMGLKFVRRMRTQLATYIISSLGSHQFPCRMGPSMESKPYVSESLSPVLKALEEASNPALEDDNQLTPGNLLHALMSE
ncbi:unnamed protein product, partial [Prorocentrum cordatum]